MPDPWDRVSRSEFERLEQNTNWALREISDARHGSMKGSIDSRGEIESLKRRIADLEMMVTWRGATGTSPLRLEGRALEPMDTTARQVLIRPHPGGTEVKDNSSEVVKGCGIVAVIAIVLVAVLLVVISLLPANIRGLLLFFGVTFLAGIVVTWLDS